MTARKLVELYVAARPGSLCTPPIVRAWGIAAHKVDYADSTLAAAMRDRLAKHSAGVWCAYIQPRQLAQQLAFA